MDGSKSIMDRDLVLPEENHEAPLDKSNFKSSVSWEEVKSRMLKNVNVANEINQLKSEYEIIQQVIQDIV